MNAFVFVIVMLSAENPQTVDFHTARRHIMGIFSRVDFFSSMDMPKISILMRTRIALLVKIPRWREV